MFLCPSFHDFREVNKNVKLKDMNNINSTISLKERKENCERKGKEIFTKENCENKVSNNFRFQFA